MTGSEFYVGTSGWTYDHWKGVFYPEKLPRRAWFDYYSEHFRVVEINATFHGWFKDQTYTNWRDRTPFGFLFVLKAPRQITHEKQLVDVGDDIRKFWTSAALLGEKFGLILLQVAPATPYEPDLLRKALMAFEDPHKVAVEFRNPQWSNPEVELMLKEIGVVYCNADSPRSRLAAKLTSTTGYIRLHGRRQWYSYDYSPQELQEIADTGRRMAAAGARIVYIFFNNDLGGYAPWNALTLETMLI